MWGGGREERAAGNGSGFVTTRGLNLHSAAYEMGGESHRLAELAHARCGCAGDESQRDLPGGTQHPSLRVGGQAPGPLAQMTAFSPSANLS